MTPSRDSPVQGTALAAGARSAQWSRTHAAAGTPEPSVPALRWLHHWLTPLARDSDATGHVGRKRGAGHCNPEMPRGLKHPRVLAAGRHPIDGQALDNAVIEGRHSTVQFELRRTGRRSLPSAGVPAKPIASPGRNDTISHRPPSVMVQDRPSKQDSGRGAGKPRLRGLRQEAMQPSHVFDETRRGGRRLSTSPGKRLALRARRCSVVELVAADRWAGSPVRALVHLPTSPRVRRPPSKASQ
jgi:hypothetical protein